MQNDYPHDGVIGWDDPFWQSLERDQTNEDQCRMTMTAAEYEAFLAECDRQDSFDHSSPWVDPRTEPVTIEEDGILYTFIEGEWVAEGQSPTGMIEGADGSMYYFGDYDAYAQELLAASLAISAAQAEQGNYLDPIT